MDSGIIVKLQNQKDFMWFSLKANAQSVYILDSIVASFDKYEEGLFFPKKNLVYKNFVPNRWELHNGQGVIYGIAIFNKDLIDLIIIKNTPEYKKFIRLMKKNFTYSTKKSF